MSETGSSRGPSALSNRSVTPKPFVGPNTNSEIIFSVFDVPPIHPAPIVTYSKEVQVWMSDSESENLSEEEDEIVKKSTRPPSTTDHESQSNLDTNVNILGSDNTFNITFASEDDLELLENDKALQQFLSHSLKVLSRGLASNYDITTNHSMPPPAILQHSPLQPSIQFKLPNATAVLALAWSPHHTELIASSHTGEFGCVNVWNLYGSKVSPEYVLGAQSAVLALEFSKSDPMILLGTCYNGQIVVWDLRTAGAKTKLSEGLGGGIAPVLESPINGQGHTHPIYAIQQPTSHTLLTASTDGTMCTWTPDILLQPQDRLSLVAPITSIAPLPGTTKFLAATEAGEIYIGERYGHAGTQPGLAKVLATHAAHVTKLDVDGALVVSSSMDWEIRVGGIEGGIIGRWTREAEVYDVCWKPETPGVFVSVEGRGWVEVWDLQRDKEAPIARWQEKGPLNRAVWGQGSESEKLAVGGLNGIITVLDVEFEDRDWAAAEKALLASLEEEEEFDI